MVQQGKKEIESIKRYIEVDLDKYRPRVFSMDISRVREIRLCLWGKPKKAGRGV